MATQQASSKKRSPQPATAGRKGAAPQRSGTVERDETYGLISVLYHALQGAETYSQYIADAERAGESEIAQFFEECKDQENQRAIRAKQLLATQLDGVSEDEDDEDEDEDEDDEE